MNFNPTTKKSDSRAILLIPDVIEFLTVFEYQCKEIFLKAWQYERKEDGIISTHRSPWRHIFTFYSKQIIHEINKKEIKHIYLDGTRKVVRLQGFQLFTLTF